MISNGIWGVFVGAATLLVGLGLGIGEGHRCGICRYRFDDYDVVKTHLVNGKVKSFCETCNKEYFEGEKENVEQI